MNNHVTDAEKISSNAENAIAGLGIEGWRFARVYLRVLEKLEATEQKKYQGQVRYFLKHLEEQMAAVGLNMVNLEGRSFDPGCAVNILNLADFENEELLVIDQMLEPVIMGPQGIVKMGTALVRRG